MGAGDEQVDDDGWMAVFARGGFVYRSLNAMISRQVGVSEQGQLQGATSTLCGLSTIIGPGRGRAGRRNLRHPDPD